MIGGFVGAIFEGYYAAEPYGRRAIWTFSSVVTWCFFFRLINWWGRIVGIWGAIDIRGNADYLGCNLVR